LELREKENGCLSAREWFLVMREIGRMTLRGHINDYSDFLSLSGWPRAVELE
jgi:hypothetical protein